MSSPFAAILQDTVEHTPMAVGGAFAAWDGETVVFICSSWEEEDWLLLTAHYGVILAHIQAALNTFHFGEATCVQLTHERLEIVMQAVKDGYFAIIALEKPCNIGKATLDLERAADKLRVEMG